MKDRKCHLLVDTMGLLLAVVVHRADINERRRASFVLKRLFKQKILFSLLSIIFADGDYSDDFEAFVRKSFLWLLQIVRKPLGIKTSQVLSKRWIEERTFSWLTTHIRLSVDYEQKVKYSEAMVKLP